MDDRPSRTASGAVHVEMPSRLLNTPVATPPCGEHTAVTPRHGTALSIWPVRHGPLNSAKRESPVAFAYRSRVIQSLPPAFTATFAPPCERQIEKMESWAKKSSLAASRLEWRDATDGPDA